MAGKKGQGVTNTDTLQTRAPQTPTGYVTDPKTGQKVPFYGYRADGSPNTDASAVAATETEKQKQGEPGLLGPGSITDLDPTSGVTNPIDDLKNAGGDLALPGGYIGASLGIPGLGPAGQAAGGVLGYQVGKEITPGEALTDPVGTGAKVVDKTIEKVGDAAGATVDGISRLPSIVGLGGVGGSTDTGALTTDTQAVRDARDRITDKLENLTPGTAPTTVKTTIAPTQVAPDVKLGPASQVSKTTIGPGQQQTVTPSTIQKTGPVTSQQITGPTLAFAKQADAATVQRVAPVMASTVGYTEGAYAPQVKRAAIAASPQEQLRQRQLRITDTLEAGATGTGGPTAAEALLLKGQERAAREQMGAAITRGRAGGNLGLAMKEANENRARIQGEGALDAAMLRAKEQQDAQGRIVQALEGARTQDIGLATKGAELAQGANLTEADLASRTGLANLEVRAKRALTQAELDQQAAQAAAERRVKENLTEAGFKQETGLANAAASNRREETRAGLELETGKANQSADLSAKTTTAQIASTEELARVELAAKVAMDNAARELSVLLEQARLDQARGIHNADLEQQIKLAQANLDQSTGQFNAAQGNTRAIAQGNITTGESKTDVESVLKTKDQDIEKELGLTGLQLRAGEGAITGSNYAVDAETKDKAIDAGLAGNILTGLGGIGAAALSDERQKKNIVEILEGPGDDDELLAAFDAIRPVKFDYKDPRAPGADSGKQVGVLAQDLEKTPAGRSVVTEKDGKKMVETGPAVMLALAAIAKIRADMQAQKGARR